MISPIGIVNEPIRGYERPKKMKSNTSQVKLGQNRSSTGSSQVKWIAVFKLGFGPGMLCAVSMFLAAAEMDGGSIDFTSNLI